MSKDALRCPHGRVQCPNYQLLLALLPLDACISIALLAASACALSPPPPWGLALR